MATKAHQGYAADIKAKALVYVESECNGNAAEASRILGIPQTTLNAWVRGRGTSEEILRSATLTRKELADKLDKLLELSVASILDEPDRLSDCNVGEIAQIIGKAVPASQLLRDRATMILAAEQPANPEEAEKELALLFAKHLPS